MTHLTEHQRGALDRLRRQHDPAPACARCHTPVTIHPPPDNQHVTLCGHCGRAPFATGSRPDHAAELAHEALGLAWAAESDPPLIEALTDLAELLDRATGRTP